MIAGYRFDLTCPRCDQPLHHAANGVSNGLNTQAVANCPPCRNSYLITVGITLVNSQPGTQPPRNPARCGTESGYNAHRRRGEPACDACRTAHATDKREREQRARRRFMNA